MGVTGFAIFLQLITLCSTNDPTRVVVRVNGTAITAGDLEFTAVQRGIPEAERGQALPKLIDDLIERQLIRDFLRSRKIEPTPEELKTQIERAEEFIKKRGEDPAALLKKIGYTPERLNRELGLTLAWQAYVRQTVTPTQIKEYFEQHKVELDGTQLRASQIFFKLPQPANEPTQVRRIQKLNEIREEIRNQKISFAEAAKKYSEAPTRDQGGDLGLFGWQGKLPAAVSHAAFALKEMELSQPIVSPFGLHLIQVTERIPGDFSLEDVRAVILDRLSQKLWKSTAESTQLGAKIEREVLR